MNNNKNYTKNIFKYKSKHTISLSEVHTFSKSCCGIEVSRLIASRKLKADSRGLVDFSGPNAASVDKEKVIAFGSQYESSIHVCSSTDFRKALSSYSWAATIDHFICSETFVWNQNNNLVLWDCEESSFLLMHLLLLYLLHFVFNNLIWSKNNSVLIVNSGNRKS